jgi:hypothetical protein
LERLKEEFEEMKDHYKLTRDKDRGSFIVPKHHMDYFLHGLEYVLQEQEKKNKKKIKQKKEADL